MKNSFRTTLLIVCSALSLVLTNCTDPLEVGAELLDEDRASVGFTDTLKLVARTEPADSIPAFSPGVGAISQFLFGRTENPYFGITECGVYFEPLLLRDLGGNIVDFVRDPTAILDSVVLVLPIDSSGIYGTIAGEFGVEVYEVTEAMEPTEVDGAFAFYSNVSYDVNPVPLASTSFRPNIRDSVFVKEQIDFATLDTVDLRRPQVRLRLDDAFGQRFVNEPDTIPFQNDSTLLDFFKGLYIKPVGFSPGIMNFSMNRSWPGVYFYYRLNGDTLSYNLEAGSIGRRISQYNHSYDTYVAGEYINDPVNNDSLMFLQGLQGLRIAFEVPGLQNFSDKVINKAELELSVEVPENYNIFQFPVADQIIVLRENSDGRLEAIADVTVLPNDLDVYFGGQPVEEDGRRLYRFNISIHTQYVIDGSEPETLYLQILPRAGNAAQIIFKGPGAAVNPPLLKLSFTDL